MSKISFITLILGPMIIVGGAMTDGDPVSSLFSVTALIIVIGGTFTALITQFGIEGFLAGFKGIFWLLKPPGIDLHKFVDQLAEWSALARTSGGTLGLEPVLDTLTDPVHKLAISLIVDNAQAADFKAKVHALIQEQEDSQRTPGEFWEAAGGYAPTIGVMGAVLGLIHVMLQLNHPELLGAGIATAFVATIYGVGCANLMFLPLGGNLSRLSERLVKTNDVILLGFVYLHAGAGGNKIRAELEPYLGTKAKPDAGNNAAQGIEGLEQAA